MKYTVRASDAAWVSDVHCSDREFFSPQKKTLIFKSCKCIFTPSRKQKWSRLFFIFDVLSFKSAGFFFLIGSKTGRKEESFCGLANQQGLTVGLLYQLWLQLCIIEWMTDRIFGHISQVCHVEVHPDVLVSNPPASTNVQLTRVETAKLHRLLHTAGGDGTCHSPRPSASPSLSLAFPPAA